MLRLLLFLALLLPCAAQPADLPVAIVAETFGNCTVQKSAASAAEPVSTLRLLYPQDRLLTGPKSKLVAFFFADQKRWVVDADTAAQMAFKNIVPALKGGKVRLLTTPASGVPAALEVPQMLLARPTFPETAPTADALEQENVALTGWVDLVADPPVFHSPKMPVAKYRFQFFDEKGAFLFEDTSTTPVYKVTRKTPLKFTKGALYQWQVVSPDGTLLMHRYAFRPLTRPQVNRLRAFEKKPGSQVEKFLIYDALGMTDANLKLVRTMIKKDPSNPYLQAALAQLYFQRGCPAHAAQVASTMSVEKIYP